MKTNINFFIISRSDLNTMKNVAERRRRGNQNAHFMFNTFYENRTFLGNVEKECKTKKVADDHMVHAHFVLDNLGFKHTFGICTINDFQLQQCLHKSASMLPNKYIACLVYDSHIQH